uniref:Putative secreted peptide n=1 Tax=Anopheles braziliensis TaxID=58242 RepID=A0A2M3ZSQ7_9DIPT
MHTDLTPPVVACFSLLNSVNAETRKIELYEPACGAVYLVAMMYSLCAKALKVLLTSPESNSSPQQETSSTLC